jgi:hypothetical protein
VAHYPVIFAPEIFINATRNLVLLAPIAWRFRLHIVFDSI